jgi:hypothetical protein
LRNGGRGRKKRRKCGEMDECAKWSGPRTREGAKRGTERRKREVRKQIQTKIGWTGSEQQSCTNFHFDLSRPHQILTSLRLRQAWSDIDVGVTKRRNIRSTQACLPPTREKTINK